MKRIKTLSPVEVGHKYLTSNILKEKISQDFNIFKLEEILANISLPNAPFKNTDHGFILLSEGKIEILLNQEQFTFSAGSILLTPAGQMNNFIRLHPASKGFIGTFNDNFLFYKFEKAIVKVLEEMLSPEQLPHFFLEQPLFDFIHQVCERVYHLRFSSQKNKFQLIQKYLQNILLELQHFHFQQDVNKRSKSDELVINFKKLLLQEISNNPKASDLANALNVSTNHLNKVLKHQTQFTTTEWISKQKILEAKFLLHYSNSSIAEIALHLGFTEATHFTKFFKKHTGILPSHYQND